MNGLNPQLLEAVNALILAIFVGMAFLVARYLWIELRSYGYHRLRAQAAVSLLVVFSGDAIKAGVIWWVRSRHNAGFAPDVITQYQDVVVGAGALLVAAGGLCYIRIWSPREWGHWPWLGTAGVAVMFSTAGIVAALCTWIFLGILFWFSRRRRVGK